METGNMTRVRLYQQDVLSNFFLRWRIAYDSVFDLFEAGNIDGYNGHGGNRVSIVRTFMLQRNLMIKHSNVQSIISFPLRQVQGFIFIECKSWHSSSNTSELPNWDSWVFEAGKRLWQALSVTLQVAINNLRILPRVGRHSVKMNKKINARVHSYDS